MRFLIQDLFAQTIVGVHNYYRGMTHFNKCFSKIGWQVRKLFYHTMEKRAKFTTEQSWKNNVMNGRYSSWGTSGYYCFDKYPIIEIGWANWDNSLIAAKSVLTVLAALSVACRNST